MKNFCGVKFLQFHSICEFLEVDDCNMDERLQSFVYYQVSEEPGIAGYIQSSIGHLPRGMWTCEHTYSLIIRSFSLLNFTVGFDREIILTAKFS